MMDSTGWNGQGHGLHPGPDEDFQQFLDMNGMSGMNNLADSLQFDFPEFQNANAHDQHLMSQSKDLDTHMAGAEHASTMLSQPSNGPGNLHISMPPAVSSTVAHSSIPAVMMPPPTPTEAISEIDAQIQFLQQQRMQQQQRQLEGHNVVFFTGHNQIVPPTPQSLELQAGNQFFASPEQHHQKQMHQQMGQPQQNQQQAIYERYHHLKEQQDMSFSPLVSPAVTPLETQFPIDSQFTMSGAYFSPLTSPALHAQADHASVFDPRLSTAGTSPIDMDLEPLPAPGPTSSSAAPVSGDLAKKARKNNAPKSRKTNVRQSPITKPQRKKTSTTPVINAQVLDQLAESLENEVLSSPVIAQQGHRFSQHLHLTAAALQPGPSSSSTGATDSENDSVSPETLTDMPPPPIPQSRSARPSPYLHPQNHSHSHAAVPGHILATSSGVPITASIAAVSMPSGFPSPATPASLMRLASPQQTSHKASSDRVDSGQDMPGSGSLGGCASTSSGVNDHIESFELPESLSMNFQNPRALPPSIHNTPIIPTTASPSLNAVSAPTSNFQHLPSPAFTKPAGSITATVSASQSPQLLPGGNSDTPTAGTTPNLSAQSQRRTPQMLPRNSKKRGSVSSIQVSPALRPRISPSIKPLLPGGVSVTEDHASRLLATKSNYQNILEGNMVPGVSYPSELSTNLTSKRTSHKIAEQGRRNRINMALQEIAALLPRPPPKEGKEGKGSDDGESDNKAATKGVNGNNGTGGGDSGPNSKASTVEMAIDYIKHLQQELANATKRAEEAEKKLQLAEGAS
ncbi:hlh transcription factor [Grosmannia clavigera kw1407]|uniref:Hlh transcription factor n=1 Tax=Grosmannia clavigera (strain kw1407 / UAMH 11150) TaxID=655863 RepID=F0XLI1_GROCL|nr:hlh transcription factor [Grosmannia clavigera kw1407]EFX01443.1 hlh transcription factor [Grosmannia clavigera kw1407]